jgi:predicted DNA-binding transcriptional regulator YafY
VSEPNEKSRYKGISQVGFLRLLEIHHMIEKKRYPNCRKLAEYFEVSQRTVERDIERLKERFNAPIEYSHFYRGYYYSQPYNLPTVFLRPGEAVSLFLGQKLLAQCKGTSLEPYLREAMEKIRKIPCEAGEVDPELLAEGISIRVEPLRGNENEMIKHFDILMMAMGGRRTVTMTYESFQSEQVTTREIDPYHLRFSDGAWYCIGYCHNRQEIRTFALDRILELSPTENKFENPKGFSIDKYLGSSWALERGKPTRIVVEFDPIVARYVRGRVWHASQEITEMPGRWLRLEITTGSLGEMQRWLMGFGSHARVIEPETLRNEMIAEFKKAAKSMRKSKHCI